PGRTTIADYAADLIALLDALQISSCIVGGQSMGGGIALQTALDHPQRIQGLILIGTGAKLSVHSDILNNILTDQAAVGERFKDWMWAKATPNMIRERGYNLFMQIDPEIAYHDYLACNQFDVRDRLAEIQQPTLVIGATEDQMTPFKYSVYLKDHLSNAQLVQIEGAGHMMSVEAGQQIADEVQTWLNQFGSVKS
ncbi:MAG TPA: alpha/beta hydrolase, partial [Phototrophicaceae bacterium]|nr:alpha/beta hydrolase [Phototrophicaceae bacterium]